MKYQYNAHVLNSKAYVKQESQTERRPHVVLLHLYEMYRNVKSIKGKK